jgi:protein-disulfide isomerase
VVRPRRGRLRWLVRAIVLLLGGWAIARFGPGPNPVEVSALDIATGAQPTLTPSAGAETPAIPPRSLTAIAGVTMRDVNRLGSSAAPITLVEFADFQCPYCAEFFRTAWPRLIDQYVAVNHVALVFKHLPVLGPESIWAAQAAECAADQGEFWAYHDALYAAQGGGEYWPYNPDNLIRLAEALTLDSTRFASCLDNDETLSRVQADYAEARQIGLRSTPAFLLDGQPLIGLWPYETFQAVIEQALRP